MENGSKLCLYPIPFYILCRLGCKILVWRDKRLDQWMKNYTHLPSNWHSTHSLSLSLSLSLSPSPSPSPSSRHIQQIMWVTSPLSNQNISPSCAHFPNHATQQDSICHFNKKLKLVKNIYIKYFKKSLFKKLKCF